MQNHTYSPPGSPPEHNHKVMLWFFQILKLVKVAGNESVTQRLSVHADWTLQIKGEPQHGHCSQLPQPVILSVKHASVDLLVCLLVAWLLRSGSYAYSKSSTKLSRSLHLILCLDGPNKNRGGSPCLTGKLSCIPYSFFRHFNPKLHNEKQWLQIICGLKKKNKEPKYIPRL